MPNNNHIKRILVVHFSQTGQLHKVLESVVSPLLADQGFRLDSLELEPVEPYPFPWPFITFINAFPEAIHEKGCALKRYGSVVNEDYDLIIIGYQVWYLAPANPVIEFLKSPEAARLLRDKPVVTVIACRNMWLMAQERMKYHLQQLKARLVGNIALVDKAGSGPSFLSTPLWMFTGKKGPYRFGIPAAGVGDDDIEAAKRFGLAIRSAFKENHTLDETLFRGLGAVKINTNQIASEKIATRSFKIWGKLFLLFGKPEHPVRKILALVYAAFLLTMILTVVPINFLLKKLLAPLLRARNEKLKEYYARPSGEQCDKYHPGQS